VAWNISITEGNTTKLAGKFDKKGHEKGAIVYGVEEHQHFPNL
jgi:hypothetical protein